MPATRAWIVAIEKYSVGADVSGDPPDLAGIAEWAVQLAEFLAGTAGLPSGNIELNLSPAEMAGYDARLQNIALPYTGATLADIRASIQKLKDASDPEDTLIVYWGGHGMGTAADRYLLTADSRGDDLEGLSVNNLVLHLRSQGFPGTQMGFIDACAEPFPRPNAYELRGGNQVPTRQFYFFSASANELASGSQEAQGFSTELLRQLKLAGGVPTDAKKFFRQLDEAFEELFQSGALQSQPFDLEYTKGSGDKWSQHGYREQSFLPAEARRAGLTASQFDFLFREMGDCPWLRNKPAEAAAEIGIPCAVAPAEQQAAALLSQVVQQGMMSQMIEASRKQDPGHRGNFNLRDAWERLSLQQEFREASWKLRLPMREWRVAARQIRKLDCEPAPAREESDIDALQLSVLHHRDFPRAQTSLIRLLEAAGRMARKRNPLAYTELVTSLKKHRLLGPLYLTAVDALPSSDERIYLSIAVEMDANTGKPSVLKARARPAEGAPFGWLTVPPGTVADQIFAIIDEVKRKYVRPLVVELLLPARLLCYSRELLKVTDEFGETWIERKNALVLRWHERLASLRDPNPKYNVGDWLLNAGRLRPLVKNAGLLICRWTGPGEPVPALGADCHVIGLKFPGPHEEDPDCYKTEFYDALRSGAPYMCWPRRKPETSPETETADLFTTGLNKLPESLATKKSAGSLVDLLLLVDDPENNPYSDKLKSMQTNPRRIP